jgi:hypothetical protein
MPVIPALERLRQEDHKCEASLHYKARSCLKKQNKIKQTKQPPLPTQTHTKKNNQIWASIMAQLFATCNTIVWQELG